MFNMKLTLNNIYMEQERDIRENSIYNVMISIAVCIGVSSMHSLDLEEALQAKVQIITDKDE